MRYTADPLLKLGLRPDYTDTFSNLEGIVFQNINSSSGGDALWEVNTYTTDFLQPIDTTNGLLIGQPLDSSVTTAFAGVSAFFNGDVGNTNGGLNYFINASYGSSFVSFGSAFVSARARGTAAAPTQTLSGDFVGAHIFASYGNSNNWAVSGAYHSIPGLWAATATDTTSNQELDIWIGGLTSKMISFETDTNAIQFNQALMSSTISMWGTGSGFPTLTLLPGGTAALYAAANTDNRFLINTPSTGNSTAEVQISSTTASRKPLILQGYASQSANLQEWQDNSGTVLASVSSAGVLTFGTDTNLYRSAANMLKTDDKFHTASEIEIDGALNHDGTTVGFFGTTPVTQQTELTDELTTVTFTAPGTPDYAVQDLVAAVGYGFVTKDEGNTVLSVIANLQTRVNELETKLVAYGLLVDAD